MPPALCGSLTFHSRGFLVSVCPSLVAPPQVRVIDPDTLELLATYDMPNAPDPPGTKAYQNFAGGGYFFLDGRDRIWSSTKTSHLFVLQVSPDGRSITKVRDYDLTSVLERRRAHQLGAAGLPGPHLVRLEEERQGRDPQHEDAPDPRRSGSARTSRTRSPSTAAGSTSSRASGCTASGPRRGKPQVQWKVTLRQLRHREAGPGRRRLGHHADDHEGRLRRDHRQRRPDERGRLPQGREAEARAAAGGLPSAGVRPGRERHRELAASPTAARSSWRTTTATRTRSDRTAGRSPRPGFARVDVESRRPGLPQGLDEHAPSARRRSSRSCPRDRPDLHLHARPRARSRSPALLLDGDQRTHGQTAFKVYAGNGLGFNNNYAGLALGPTGTAYLGVTGGLIALRDG